MARTGQGANIEIIAKVSTVPCYVLRAGKCALRYESSC
jgi:hypothetical protein